MIKRFKDFILNEKVYLAKTPFSDYKFVFDKYSDIGYFDVTHKDFGEMKIEVEMFDKEDFIFRIPEEIKNLDKDFQRQLFKETIENIIYILNKNELKHIFYVKKYDFSKYVEPYAIIVGSIRSLSELEKVTQITKIINPKIKDIKDDDKLIYQVKESFIDSLDSKFFNVPLEILENIETIVKELGYVKYKYLSYGSFGVVFNVYEKDGSEKILKITSDHGEAKFANYVRRKNYKHFNYYDVREIIYNDEKYDTYSIVSDVIKPLNEHEKKVWDKLFLTSFQIIKNLQKVKKEGIKEFLDKFIFEEFWLTVSINTDEEKNTLYGWAYNLLERLINQYNSIKKELGKYYLSDLHSENVGFKKDGTFAIMDPSFGVMGLEWSGKLKPIFIKNNSK